MRTPTLFLFRGAPGSGKTTAAEALMDKHPHMLAHFEADMFFEETKQEWHPSLLPRAHDWCIYSTYAQLCLGCDVVVSNTFTRLWELEPYLEMVQKLRCKLVVKHCINDFWQSVHSVPEDLVQRMRRLYQPLEGEQTYEK